MDISIFRGYSTSLDQIPKRLYSDISDVIFSQRQNIFSVCIVFNSLGSLQSITKNVPSKITEGSHRSYAVDLESINSNQIRYYVRPNDMPGVEVIGYLVDSNGNVIEKKIYERAGLRKLSINRYDSSDNLISPNEPEGRCSEEEWKGPKELIDIARNNGLRADFLKKFAKDQSYLLIREPKTR